MLMQFGQFLAHDVALTVEAEEKEEESNCCRDDDDDTHEQCMPIRLPLADRAFRGGCMNFSRSAVFCGDRYPHREQENGITAFVDASNVYGSDEETARSLRTLEGGRLKVSVGTNGQELLPRVEQGGDGGMHMKGDEFELKAGDNRAGEMPGLLAMHTLFVREHNRLAGEMAARLPEGTEDERIYQEARRVLIAVMQNIVYSEFLPAVLGEMVVHNEGLVLYEHGTTYDEDADPSILNSFATAAFRFGHSLIQGRVNVRDIHDLKESSYRLRDNFFNASRYFDEDDYGTDRILFGIAGQPSQAGDRFIARDVADFVVSKPGAEATDLIARNVQRGRDHGLPGYNSFRSACHLRPSCSWLDPPAEVDPRDWRALSSLYAHPGDADLFAAGLAERAHAGGVVGRTFGCILAEQFRRLLVGDRYFFTHSNGAHGLSPEAVKSARRRTLADIICDNTEVPSVPSNVFLLGSKVISCDRAKVNN